MRRRCDQVVFPSGIPEPSHSTSLGGDGHSEQPALKISEVPELWRKHAREPWKVIFPDLEWKAPEFE